MAMNKNMLSYDDDDDDEPAPLLSMLRASQLVYRYASIRNLVRKHDRNLSSYVPGCCGSEVELVDFITPSNVVTQRCACCAKNKVLKSAYLRHCISPRSILKFIQDNRNFIDEGTRLRPLEDRNKHTNEFNKLHFEIKLERMVSKFDADIWEFDDEYVGSELIFAVVVNRSEKRIDCVFRGSATRKDWQINFKVCQTQPNDIEEFAGDVGLHLGFSNYLFNANWTNEGQGSKFQQIVDVIQEIRSKKASNGDSYKDYAIMITGHSLGGALAQLLAFALAGSYITRNSLPMPITAITFASPQVGNRKYLKAFKKLEKRGSLRHIRVSNDGDRICAVPDVPFMGYSQTGVNIHLFPGKRAEVKYCKQRSYWSTIRCCNALALHRLDSYHERLFQNKDNKKILKLSVDDFYEKIVEKNYVKNDGNRKSDDVTLISTIGHTNKLYKDFMEG